MRPMTTVAVGMVTLSLASAGGILTGRHLSAATPATAAATAAGAEAQRYRVPVGKAQTRGGDAQAKVTIIEYSDYQCPYCGSAERTLERVAREYKGKGVRVVWKDTPLPFHENAMPAAEAARAAGEQGKFWEMHDLLFSNQQKLDRASLEQDARDLGLDVEQFRAALDSHKFQSEVEADRAEAVRFGAKGTPTFFVNGRPFRGALPIGDFKKVIDEELATARGPYEEIVKNGHDGADSAKPKRQPGEADPDKVYKAEIGSAPVRGTPDAKVTLVVWSDFQCPFCGRFEKTLDQVRQAYGNQVRVAWKNMPLPFHEHAVPAAEAAMAANAQGRFWEMHDLLFRNQAALDDKSLERYAVQLGLDGSRFDAAMKSHQYRAAIEADMRAGQQIGASSTPTLFINGKPLVGAQPFDAIKARIDAELQSPKPYDELMRTAETEVPVDGPPIDTKVYTVDAGDSYARGPSDAPITIVEFSDFECPYCSRIEPTLANVVKAYGDKVRVVWKNYPLTMHQHAELAALAVLAAGQQGRFWEMHDKLFAHQEALDRPSLEKYAHEIGLNLAKFRVALRDKRLKEAITRDQTQAKAVMGPAIATPTVFINGRKIIGAVPMATLKQVIDEELTRKHLAMR